MSQEEKSLEDVLSFIENTAAHYGWAVVADEEFRTDLAQGLLTNYKRFGFLQCPCRDSYGDREHDRDIMCPCVYCAMDIDEYGQCFCGLFQSQEFAEQGKEPSPIPERRPERKFPY